MPPKKTPSPASVARSLDLPVSLLPFVGALFDGLDSLGSDPAMVARALTGIPSGACAIDLACGKGGVAVALGRRLRVTGVDACPEFVRAARTLAKKRGVRCMFRVGAVRDVKPSPTWDVAMMLGLFGVEKAAPLLRRFVKPGGVYVVDDAFREEMRGRASQRASERGKKRDPMRELYLSVPTLRESRAVFEGYGDEVVEEIVPTRRAVRELNRDLYHTIDRNAQRLAKREPKLSRTIEAFLARQREGNKLLSGPIRPAMWVVRKGSVRAGEQRR